MISFSSSLKHSLDKKNLILMREKLRNQKKEKNYFGCWAQKMFLVLINKFLFFFCRKKIRHSFYRRL